MQEGALHTYLLILVWTKQKWDQVLARRRLSNKPDAMAEDVWLLPPSLKTHRKMLWWAWDRLPGELYTWVSGFCLTGEHFSGKHPFFVCLTCLQSDFTCLEYIFFRKGVLCELVFFFSKEVKFLIVFYVCFLPHQYFSWRDRGCTTTLLAFKRGDFSAVIVSFILKFTPIIKKYTTSFSIPKLWSTECDWLYLMSFFFHFPLSFLSS